MIQRSMFALLLMVSAAVSSASAQDAQKIRDIAAGLVGASLCAGDLSKWCGALGVLAATWVDKGVSIVIDRYFDSKDQSFSNEYGITICYKDGKCIKPQKK